MSMTRLVTLTAEQIDLIVELLPMPLERELLEEDLSPTLRHEIEHDLERVNDILEILLDATEHTHQRRNPMNHKKKLLATTAAVAVAATIAAPTSADAQLIDEALS